jgi:hypothetical protein
MPAVNKTSGGIVTVSSIEQRRLRKPDTDVDTADGVGVELKRGRGVFEALIDARARRT